MGLRNSPQTFQKLMDSVLSGVSGTFCYLDDILVFSENEKDHLQTIEEIFKRLASNGLAVHLSKCEFGKQSLDYLGYTVSESGLTPIKKKVTAIENFPKPLK